ncbi:MAG: filamentous hemagglutinin N-terminal domain-containing protein, partial [Pseudanabaenaceae cyanobacterium bins.39]|nr:filamentous hemagglutinin N-terminal domain-containing protein [Pseudanabaenaceae cyanobacterium bins.39]
MLLRTKPFGVLSVFVVAGNILTIPLDAYAQITVDGSTATEVRGNVVSPTGAGTVSGGNLYNSFQEFNVPTSGVIFNTGSSTVDGSKINNIINRVTGDNPSAILGTIESRQAFPNANLFLLNPNGVVFSSNAKLDIGGSFNVSTGTGLGFDQNQKFIVDRNSLNFPSGDPKNIQFAVSQPAAIINQGNLSVAAGKDITITAGTVVNSGNLSAPNGNVSLAAVSGNSQVELRSPDLVLGLSVLKNAVPTNWNGTISALPKLAELLTGQVDQANQVVVRPDGSIALVASPNPSDIVVKDGMAIASGRIDVSSDSAKGGNVGIFGNQVGLVNSLINASGSTGGGNVLIGGDLQGKGIAPNALQTYVDGNSQILANGTLTGDGGKVIIWADRSTQFYGAIAARGGDISGNGGFVEVSGKDNLVYQGNTDTRAINGTTGILLLDPQNITIIAGANNPAELAANDQFADPGINNTINNGTINAATTNVILQATNDITFNAPISIASAGVGITAQAGNSIFVNSSITTNRGNVSLTANDNTASTATGLGNISIGSNIATNGGAINIKTSSSPGFGKSSIIINANSEINSNGGVIDIQGSGNGDSDGIDIRSTITSNGGAITIQGKSDGININVGSEINSNSGAILIKSDNSRIEVDGNISSTTGNVTLIANGRSLGLGISGNAKISTETGTITLNATGSNTIAPRDGLSISGANVAITSISGDINISGRVPNTAGGTGLIISDSTITTNGNINITGNTANPNELGIIISSPTNKLTINSGSGNLTFTSDRSIFPNVGFRGTGTLSLQPFSNNTSLVVNSSVSNTSPGTANVFADKSFFDALAASPSFSNRAIGSTTTSNPITLANPISLTSPLQLNSNNATITFASTINGTHDLTVNSGTGDVNFELTSTIGNTTSLGNITINSSGTTRFLSPVFNAASLTTDAGGRTFLYDNLTTTGLQTYNDAVSLFTPIQLNTTNGAIAFNNTINGSQNLTVNSGNGNIIFGGAIGNTTPLANLTANSLGIT